MGSAVEYKLGGRRRRVNWPRFGNGKTCTPPHNWRVNECVCACDDHPSSPNKKNQEK